jgi:MFS family permease
MATRARSPLWRHRDFLLLWSGQTTSQVGAAVGAVAVPLLAATVLGASPFQMGLLTAAESIGFLLVGLPAGALLDRVRKIPVMVGADVVRLVLLLSVPVAWWAGVLTFTQLTLVVLAVGVATVFFDVGYQSVLPAVGGPALGGGLVQLAGAANAVLLDAMSYLVSAVLLARMRTAEPPPGAQPRRSLRAEMGEGLRYVLGHRLLRPIALCTGSSNLFGGVLAAVSVLFLARELALPAGIVGLVLAVGSVGGLAGALTSGAWTRRFGQARVLVAVLFLTAPGVLLQPLAQPGPRLAFYAAGSFALGYGVVVYNVAQVSFRQTVTPDRLLGRMNASIRFLVWGTLPLGGLLGGALGELIGLRATLLVGAVGLVLAPLWLLASPLRRMRDLPAAA